MKFKAKAPVEDPRLKAQRERAEQIAETQVISETQRRLEEETAAFGRRFGARAATGGLPGGNFRAGLFKFGGGGNTGGGKFSDGLR